MTTIGSTPHQHAGSHYRPSEKVGPDGLTDGQRFTKEHAHLSPSDYVFAKLAFSEQRSAERLASGEADHTFQVRFNDRIFTIAGTRLDVSLLKSVPTPMVPWVYPMAEASEASPPQGAAQDASTGGDDFSAMSRQEIADAGKALFQAGRITLDELFVMEHPDGILRIDANGNDDALDPDQQIDFLAEIREAIRDLELAGSARLPGSLHDTLAGLLSKITTPA